MESNSKDKRVAKAFALIVALTLLMLGFYCLVQEQIRIPSRSSTVEQVVTRPSSYFVGAGTILLGLSIAVRSEEHTSELQSRENLVCRLLLEKENWSMR